MSKKVIVFYAVLLLALNFFAWQEVFVLAGPHFLKVSFLSVGQGDSIFIETPQDHHILIDGGPNSVVLEKLNDLLPFWDRSLDLVILSHPEKDHMTGILDILQRYKVKYFLWTGIDKDNVENKQLAILLDRVQQKPNDFLASLSNIQPTKVITISSGDRIRAGDVLIDTLYPLEDVAGKEFKNTNDTCVVSRLIYGENSFLFTGDIGFSEEKDIVNSKEDISSNVLKVAHHGSKYSTSELFLENVKPEVAVIEVGKNSYGHPTPETLQRLEKFGIKVFNTYTDGDIEVLSDGNKIYFQKK